MKRLFSTPLILEISRILNECFFKIDFNCQNIFNFSNR
eukprot:UN14260